MTGLQSLFGLMMATSGCPILSRLRPLADYHLPFADIDETVHRVVGTYLMRQYFEGQETGTEPDLELTALKDYYKELEIVDI